MAEINFTQFDLKQRADLKSGDFLVGYKNDGTREFRTTLSSLTASIQMIQGIQGSRGLIGVQGLQGFQGAPGNRGVQGTQGAPGEFAGQGVQGIQGDLGLQGTQGPQGEIGIQGITGIQGLTGVQGVQGFRGSQGIQGLVGVQGDTGIQGLTGNRGNQGLQGTQGVQGEIGIQGLDGTQGLQGPQGLGPQGLQGTRGLQGTIGQTGAAGTSVTIVGAVPSVTLMTPQSALTTDDTVFIWWPPSNGNGVINEGSGDLWVFNTGTSTWSDVGQIRGPQGIQGERGLQGIQGTRGLQGLQGIQGLLGNQGLQGIQGISVQGIQGVQGTTPNIGAVIKVTQGASQAVNNNTFTAYRFDNTVINSDTSLYALEFTSDNLTSKIRINSGGTYLILYKLTQSNLNYSGFFRTELYQNGGTVNSNPSLLDYGSQARTSANETAADSIVANGQYIYDIPNGDAPRWITVGMFRINLNGTNGGTVATVGGYSSSIEVIKIR